MIAPHLISHSIPPLHLDDSGEQALMVMHEYNVSQLPVVDGNSYVGLVIMEDIINMKHLSKALKNFSQSFRQPFVKDTAHIFDVMKASISGVTVLGLIMWRNGIIKISTGSWHSMLFDMIVFIVLIDLSMYLLHKIAHFDRLFPLLHSIHHTHVNPKPISLFILHPFETLSFGALWLTILVIYSASWPGVSQMENHYNTLGIAPNATEDDIKKVYRSLAMRFHPDRNQAPGAEARFKSITKAYEILSDPVKREEYNQSVNHSIIIDAEAEAYQLWRSVFNLHGTVLPPA